MKILTAILMVSIFFSCSNNNFNSDYLPFEIKLAQSEPGPNLKEMNLYSSDQKFFVYDSVFLKNADITSTKILDWQTHPKVGVTLNDAGREKFAEFTENNVDKIAAIIVDNKLVSAPKINAQIKDGQLVVVGFFNHDDAVDIADGILPKD